MDKIIPTILVLILYIVSRILGFSNEVIIMMFTVFNTIYIVSIDFKINEQLRKKVIQND